MEAKKVKYIRDHVFSVKHTDEGPEVVMTRYPVACVVQDEHGNCGVSVCNNLDLKNYSWGIKTFYRGDAFSKAKAKKIALGRAAFGSNMKYPTRKITNVFGKEVRICDEINFWVNKFKEQVAKV